MHMAWSWAPTAGRTRRPTAALAIVVGALATLAAPCGAVSVGGVPVKSQTLSGYTQMNGCRSTGGKEATALAIYPADASPNKTYPYLAFAHGMNCDPAATYTAMLNSVAASGYIVIAPNGDNDGWCVAQYKDQLRGIDVAYEKRSHFPYSAIDWRMGVGLLGHSMGAHATVQSAGMRPASPVAIKAAMAFAPQYFPPGEPSFADKVRVPIFYVSASGDKIVAAAKVRQQYNDTDAKLSKVFAELKGYNHMSVSTSNTFSYFTAAFFNCHMLGRTEGAGSCDSIYDASRKAWCPLCGNQHGCPHVWPMQVCETSYSVQLYKN